ncbi:MAG: TetR/AcrR family transcriptional regulator [Hydrogenophilaceae bacterium]|jgi:AcrR family transcriptional regulator|nr:TetR/AcrR family transcriptional regulator [Hydrogenophilaceae bacterium]
MSAFPSDTPDQTARYAEKRERILDVATDLINERGVKGMTFVDVAQRVDLNTTSITYYFKRKELLAEAAFERSLDRIEARVEEACRKHDPQARVAAYVDAELADWARVRRKEARPMARLSDLRAMDEPIRTRLGARYLEVQRRAAESFFGAAETAQARALRAARMHVLAENVYWMPAWLGSYSVADFDRVGRRLVEILSRGVAGDGAPWRPLLLAIEEPRCSDADAGRETFIRAASRLINERGYKGASVERIASDLNVTKGSFYHHLDAKDDLVLECFERSYARVSLVQRTAIERGGADYWTKLSAAIATLLDVQFRSDFPLLRTAALQALPTDVRHAVVERSNRIARRFAGMLIDGVSEGSIRAIDPLIASQTIMASINGAYDLRKWAAQLEPARAIEIYASTIAYGLFADV